MTGRTTRAKVGDHAYDIPDIWLFGMTQHHRLTVEQAIRYWHDQSMMAAWCEADEAGESAA